jgi:hypothetical protein
MIRGAIIAALVVAAGLLAALAIDVGGWQSAHARPPTLLGHTAERLLATGDDVALWNATAAFVAAERVPYGFDNGQNQARVRALAEARLADVAARAPAAEAAQANDLLGVLAWGGTGAPAGVVDPADRAIAAFTDAALLDPADTDAKFNLEVALRAVAGHGVRHGPNSGGPPRGIGQSGAGAGTPGQGY